MPERLRLVPPMTDEARAQAAQAELEVLRARIRAGAERAERLAREAESPRERWLRRILRAVQSNRTTAR